MADLLDSLADEAADLSSAPTDNEVKSLQKYGMELVELDQRVSDLEAMLSEAKKERYTMAHQTLPDLMNQLGTDNIGLASANVDIELHPYCHASIPKDWDDEKRQAAFDHLEELGAGDIVKSIMTVTAGKGDLEAMRTLVELVKALMEGDVALLADLIRAAGDLQPISAPVNLEMTVPWNTLTSYVKEQVEKGTALDLVKLNATVGQVVKIKQRK